ncbi:MAG: hypothetical protein RJB66_2714 [Pseudomonadota bacterium]|jgi:hypothetical protein
MHESYDASFSVLVTSIASSAAISLGIAPNPSTGKTEPDRAMAKFNIDLLTILKDKTKNNLSEEEQNLINFLVQDLHLKFVQMSK